MAIKTGKKIERSKYWNELVDVLEKEFPKRRCKERGHALVLLAYAEMYLQEAEKEKEKLYDWCFKKCGEECEKAIKFEKEKLLERKELKVETKK